MRYDHILLNAVSTPWAIQEDQLQVLLGVLARRAAGHETPPQIVSEVSGKRRPNGPYIAGMVGVLPLYGAIFPKANLVTEASGGTSLQMWMRDLEALMADDDAKAIVIDVDSPGGSVSGIPEAASRISAMRGTKPIVAVSNYLNASAAYWLSAQADELVASPSSMTGSIGVFSIHESIARALDAEGIDITLIKAGRYKAEGNEFEPLSEEAAGAMQAIIDEVYGQFVASVASGRGVTDAAVRTGFGEGRVLTANRARAEGVVDRVSTVAEAIALLQETRGRNAVMRGRRADTHPPRPINTREIAAAFDRAAGEAA